MTITKRLVCGNFVSPRLCSYAKLLLVLLISALAGAAEGNTNLVPDAAVWRYLDNGSNQGTAWRDPAFNDQTWKSGPAQLGYGDGDEATVVSYGSKSTTKYITTYFRHTFSVVDPANFETLTLRLLRDDGAIVYLNGVEVHRSNLPTGSVSSTTLASSAVDGANESVVQSIDTTNLRAGSNVLAVEIHQNAVSSSDISFQLAVDGIARVPSSALVPAGSTWKYLDNGTDQGTAWKAVAFNDSTWAAGPAELGYGDGGERTVINSGPSTNKYPTTYFRRSFNVTDPAEYHALTLRLMRDDGAVVYLNGTEVHRSNMPTGPITYSTFAPVAVGGADESTFFQATIGNLLTAGTNVLAVEVHQSDATSTDVSFDLELLGLTDAPAITITRGPYLQNATPTSMVVRWRTDVPATSKVWYGSSPADLTEVQENVALTTEHEVAIPALAPNTQYYYAVGSNAGQIASGSEYTFFTPPLAGTKQPLRVWVIGDSGTGNANALAVKNAYENFNGSQYTDMWLMLGDNAYNNGTDSEFQTGVFNMYPSMLRQSPLWSTLGNHDYYTAQGAAYFNLHTFPTQAEAGGAPSGTEKYYSFDYGNVHFISLDSMSSDRSPTGPMATWLQADLASTTQDWIVAFFHHPPYTKGSHNSDNPTGSDLELLQMRENFLPILEAGGVDLVLGGHSHSYERSYLIDGHYGLSQTFSDSMKKASGNGKETNGLGAYAKPTGLTANQGAVYAVAGSSGKATNWWGGSTALVNPNPHPAMVVSLLKLGSLVLDINDDRLDVKFLNSTGGVDDEFTIRKDVPNSPPTAAISSPTQGATVNSPVTISVAATPGPESEGGSVRQVDIYAGGALIGTAESPSATGEYEVVWNNAASGSHVLTATAWDDKGASADSAPVTVTVNAAPVVLLTSPTQNASYDAPATIAIAATASDSDGTVAQVAFYAGAALVGTDVAAPFEVAWENVAAGTYQLTAVATDEQGGSGTSAPVAVTVAAPNMAPAVTLTSPAGGATYQESASIELGANAADSDGSVSKVDFYAGATLLFSDTTSPYGYTWSNAAAGSHSLTAVATDDDGLTTTSAAVGIVVNPNQAPSVTFTGPANGAVYMAPASIALSANAMDSDGSVVRVEFYAAKGAAQPALVGSGTKGAGGDNWSYNWASVAAGDYALTAVAVDNNGATTTVGGVQVTVNPAPNVAPTVAISSPANGADYKTPANISITATAEDSDGTVAKVEFFRNSGSGEATLIGTDLAAPFALSWNNAPVGVHDITALATDDLGETATSAAVTITVADNVGPTVSLTSPADSAVYTAPATVTLSANAADSDGSVTAVEFFANGAPIGTDSSAPYSVTWNNVASGSYVLAAVAMDDNGAQSTSAAIQITVDPTPNVEPTVVISSPANGASYIAPANVAITATAGDADGTVTKVEFYQNSGTGEATLIGSDTSSPYAVSWESVAAGAYTLTAVVTDNSGATTTSQPVSVSVVPNAGPTVNLTSPADSSVFNAPATVSLTANAADSDGSVTSVSFYVNGGSIATDLTAPYSAGWSTSVAGSYTLTAVATDNLGKTTTSAPVVITVNPEPAPAAPSALTARASKARIDLTWLDNSSNEAGFEVWRSTNGTDFTFFTTVDANVKTYRDSAVTAGITYYYKVKAFKGSLSSDFSAVASVRAR